MLRPFNIFLINKAKLNLYTLYIAFAEPTPDLNASSYAVKSCMSGTGQEKPCVYLSEARLEQAAESFPSEFCFLGMWNRLESHHQASPREHSLESPTSHFTPHLMTAFLNEFAMLCFSFIFAPRLHIIIILFPIWKACLIRILFYNHFFSFFFNPCKKEPFLGRSLGLVFGDSSLIVLCVTGILWRWRRKRVYL